VVLAVTGMQLPRIKQNQFTPQMSQVKPTFKPSYVRQKNN